MSRVFLVLCFLALLTLVPCPSPACSLCGNVQQAPTFRQEAGSPNARLILCGTLQNPRLTGGRNGTTELRVEAVLRSDPFLGKKEVVELPRYIPVSDPKNPPRFLVFCDIFENKLDPYRGVPLKSADAVEYAKKALELDPKDRTGALAFFFRYLENPDKEVARDAFLEFAKATDKEVGQVASRLSPEKLRGWLKNPETPAERLSVYALMLGACGGDEDAAFLQSLLRDPGERVVNAYDGILAGYIHLRPREGWELALATAGDGHKPLPVRLAVVRTLRFYHGWKPQESRDHVLKGLETLLGQGELADVAVEELRRWQMWDLTREVLALYGKKGFEAPLMSRAIIRYALSCKEENNTQRYAPERNAAIQFLAEHRRLEPDLIKEVEESLQFDKRK